MGNRRFAYWNWLQSSPLLPPWRRAWLLRRMGVECAQGSVVREGCFFGSTRLRIGAGCFINHQCYFDGNEWIEIGEKVHLAARVQILTSTHDQGSSDCRAGPDRHLPVKIGRGAWIGAGAVILPGVTIAPGCIVAAGAVVHRDTMADGLYAGVPAARKSDLSDPEGALLARASTLG